MKQATEMLSFKLDQARMNMQTLAEVNRQNMLAHQQTYNQTMAEATKLLTEMRTKRTKTIAEVAAIEAKQNAVAEGGE